jgi:hypothetical protein
MQLVNTDSLKATFDVHKDGLDDMQTESDDEDETAPFKLVVQGGPNDGTEGSNTGSGESDATLGAVTSG